MAHRHVAHLFRNDLAHVLDHCADQVGVRITHHHAAGLAYPVRLRGFLLAAELDDLVDRLVRLAAAQRAANDVYVRAALAVRFEHRALWPVPNLDDRTHSTTSSVPSIASTS